MKQLNRNISFRVNLAIAFVVALCILGAVGIM